MESTDRRLNVFGDIKNTSVLNLYNFFLDNYSLNDAVRTTI